MLTWLVCFVQDETPLGFEYTTTEVLPSTMSIVPILRSGLGMVEGELIIPRSQANHHPKPAL